MMRDVIKAARSRVAEQEAVPIRECLHAAYPPSRDLTSCRPPRGDVQYF